MNIIIKLSAGILVSLVLLLILDKSEKHMALLLAVAVCCSVMAIAADYLQQIIQLVNKLQSISEMDVSVLSQVLKAVAVAVICEITSTLCGEAGYGSLGKVLQFVGTSVILYLSVPLITNLLEIITAMLGGL